jgi:glucose/arabinose dehydrogenase
MAYIVGNDGANSLTGTAGADAIYGFDPNGPQSQASAIVATRVATGLNQPLFAAAPPGDPDHLFIVQKTGQIKVLDLDTGQTLATPFLDVSGQILTDTERGLLGLAFDPDYANNGFLYVNLINTSGNTEIRRYHVSSNPTVADPASATPVITIPQPAGSANHKAGWLGFGPDGYLYAALGDGGGSGDPFHNGQNIDSLLGKILRIDVHGDAFASDPTKNYAIPADNPFVGTAGADEIFAYGLRNPWRDSFDRALGNFYIADVGQGQWEEIDIGQRGANYGWNNREGPVAFPGGDPLTGGPAVDPIYTYNHTVGQSITGGYVYRGEGEALQGQYFFADFVQGKVFTLRFDGSTWVATDRTTQITTDFGAVNNPSSFGEDARGNLYLVDFDGDVFRLTPTVASADQADVLRGLAGNDFLFAGSGNDTLEGGPGADTLIGGPGLDTADYVSSAAGVTVNLLTGRGLGGDAQGDLLAGIENIAGSGQADRLIGDNGNNVLVGGRGNDVLIGGAGTDTAAYNGTLTAASISKIVDADPATPGNQAGWQVSAGSEGIDLLSGVERINDGAGHVFLLPAGLPRIGPVGAVAAGDFNSNGMQDYIWRDASADMTKWEYAATTQQVAQVDLGTVGFSWHILASDHFSNASTTQMLTQSAVDGTMTLWWVNDGQQLTGVNIGQKWNGIDYIASGQFTDFGGAGMADFLVTNVGDHHLYNWWIDSNYTLQGIDLGAAWSNISFVGTGEFTPFGKTDFLVSNTVDHHLYDWWIDPASGTLQGLDLGAAWSNVGYIASGKFTANGGGNDNLLIFNQSDHHLYDWWIDAASGTLQGVDLGAHWSNVEFLASGHFDNNTTNEQMLVRNTVDNHLYEWWIDSTSHALTGIDLGAHPGIEFIDSGHFNNANGSTTNDELLVHNTGDGHLYGWWIANNQLSGVDLTI